MSRVEQPLQREPVEIDARKMHAARRARIIARDKTCKYPGCEVSTALEVDHIVALGLGGKDVDSNLECLCEEHHKAKTKRDKGLIAKAKRQGLKDRGEFPPSPTPMRQGRGFQRRWRDS